MEWSIVDLKRRLADSAEAVCRRYLSNGRREGRYWLVGDVDNSPGRSLYVRLRGPAEGHGAAGRWTDAATGEGGDLLDLIAARQGLTEFREVVAEARRFLALPAPARISTAEHRLKAPAGSLEAARRLFAAGRSIAGTGAEAYLRARGLTELPGLTALRFHPRCFHRTDDDLPEAWPALLAAVTDLRGRITGVHRTWLDRAQPTLAPLADPRRSMGELSGHAVRFGQARRVLIAGEGLETVLSVRCALPTVPHAAALSAAHLGAVRLPPSLRRLYITRDRDDAGERAAERLRERAEAQGVQVLDLLPERNDFNDDLRADRAAMIARIGGQLAAPERARLAQV